MQDRLYRAIQRLGPQHRLQFRVEVDLGDMLDDGDDLHGHGQHRRPIAEPWPGRHCVVGRRAGADRGSDWACLCGMVAGGGSKTSPSRCGCSTSTVAEISAGPPQVRRSLVRRAVDSAITALAAASALASAACRTRPRCDRLAACTAPGPVLFGTRFAGGARAFSSPAACVGLALSGETRIACIFSQRIGLGGTLCRGLVRAGARPGRARRGRG